MQLLMRRLVLGEGHRRVEGRVARLRHSRLERICWFTLRSLHRLKPLRGLSEVCALQVLQLSTFLILRAVPLNILAQGKGILCSLPKRLSVIELDKRLRKGLVLADERDCCVG